MRLKTDAIFVALFAGAVCLAALPRPAHAEEENLMEEALNELGLASKKKAAIEYRERAPIVIPKDRTLPPPRPKAEMASNPAWPKDPDVLRRQKEDEEDKLPFTQQWKYVANRDSALMLKPDELAGGRVAGANVPTWGDAGATNDLKTTLTPDELKRQGRSADAGSWAKAEPKRQALTDPPAGYRTPAPTAPYQASDGKSTDPGKTSWWQKLNPF